MKKTDQNNVENNSGPVIINHGTLNYVTLAPTDKSSKKLISKRPRNIVLDVLKIIGVLLTVLFTIVKIYTNAQ